jgi:hypothetical protein
MSDPCLMNLFLGPVFTKGQLVYVAQAGDYVKIGVTNSPDERIKAIQTACPLEVKLLWTNQWDECNDHRCCDPIVIERELHRSLRDFRVRGEWFEVDIDQVMVAWQHVWTKAVYPAYYRCVYPLGLSGVLVVPENTGLDRPQVEFEGVSRKTWYKRRAKV